MPAGRTPLAAIVGLVVLAAAACTSTPAPTHPTSGPHPVFARVQAGPDLDGAPASRYFTPGEPTIFVVFASWCSHCRRELDLLDELHRAEPRVHVIGLNAYEDWDDTSDEDQLRVYLAANAPWLPVVRTDPAMLAALGGVPKIPSLFVFDGTGRLVTRFARHQRPSPDLPELRRTLAPLLPL